MTHTNRTRAALQVALLLCLSTHLAGQCGVTRLPTGGFPGVEGRVFGAMAWDPDGPGPAPRQTLVMGEFSHAGDVECIDLALYDHASGAWSAFGGGTNGHVLCATVMPNSDLVIGGQFTIVDGVVCNNIARWDGQSWSPLGTGAGSAVEALQVMPNGDLMVGGRFLTAGGVSARCLARWDGSGWSFVPGGQFSAGFLTTPRVTSLALMPNGDLMVGGWFTNVGAATIVALARYDGSGWSSLGGGLNSGVDALAVRPNGDLIVGGSFGTAGGINAPGLARWDGAAWTPYGSGLRRGVVMGSVRDIVVRANGDVVVAGEFDTAGGMPAHHVARWDGSSWHALGDGVSAGTSFSPSVADCLSQLPTGDLLLGGQFERVGAATATGAAVWNGTLWKPTANGCSGEIRNFALAPSGDLYAVGAFASIGGTEARGVARWDGVRWSPLGDGSALDVRAVAVLPGGDVVVGGNVPSGQSMQPVARWDGSHWHDMPGLNGPVRALYVDDRGRLFAGGAFSGGVSQWRGSDWTVLGGGVGSGASGALPHVQAMVTLPNGDLVVSGGFLTAGGITALRYARWDGSVWHAMAAGQSRQPALSMCVLPDGSLVAHGDFLFGTQPTHIVRWDGASWTALAALGFSAIHVGPLAMLPNGDLLASGPFQFMPSVGFVGIARWDGATWHPFHPVAGNGAAALAVLPDGTVVAGGSFVEVDDEVSPRLAMLAATCPANATDLGGGCAGSHGSTTLVATQLPWAGAVFEARGTGLAPMSLAAGVYGFAAASNPLGALLPQAAPGCTVRTTADFVALTVASQGEVTTSLPIPDAASLVGVGVHHQLLALELDSNGALVEAVASNALRAQVGSW